MPESTEDQLRSLREYVEHDSIELGYVEQGDGLIDRQIDTLLSGEFPDDLDEWISDNIQQGLIAYVDELVQEYDIDAETVLEDDALRELILERDKSNVFSTLVNMSDSRLYQVTPKDAGPIREYEQSEMDVDAQGVLLVYLPLAGALALNDQGGELVNPHVAFVNPFVGSATTASTTLTVAVGSKSVTRDGSLNCGSVNNICGLVESEFSAEVRLS